MQNISKKALVIGAIIFVAALSRMIPHPMNFAPLGAMAIFGAAYFGNRGLGLLITMITWFLSDLLLNNIVYSTQSGLVLFTEGAVFIYGSITLIFFLGKALLKKVFIGRMLLASLSASVIFFVVSNFGVWMHGMMYPMTTEGLIMCYSAAIPFFKMTVAGDLAYSGVLFIAYERLFRQQLDESKINNY